MELFSDPMDCSPPSSSVQDFPGKNTEWVAVSSLGNLTHPGIETEIYHSDISEIVISLIYSKNTEKILIDALTVQKKHQIPNT